MPQTTLHAFFQTAQRFGPRLAWKHGERQFTWSEAAHVVRRAARAFIALGVKPGECVSIMGPNRPEWVIADLAAIAAGAVPAPIYPTLTAEQAGYIARHSAAVVAVVQDVAQLQKLRAQRPASLRWFVLIAGAGDAPDVLTWDQFLARAADAPESAVDERLAGLKPRGLATLIYTSGTTGPPKAVMLCHENLLFAAQAAQRIAQVTADDILISYLPLSHIAEQMISVHGPATHGSQIWFCDELPKAPEVLRAARPTIFFGVPRVWEKMQARTEQGLAAAPPLRRALASWARKSRGRLADKLVLSKIRALLGLDRVRLAITGAAAMSLATLRFFESLGIDILDMWGLSESTAMGTANLRGARKAGTIGRPTEGVEIRIAPDGEILTRGPHVFLGYYKDEAATREALDVEGFLHTGDVGEFDNDGYVRITDRKKDLLITSGGKNVSPQNIEGRLVQIPGVAQAAVLGDARKHLAALLTPDPDAARRLPGVNDGTVESLAVDPAFLMHIGRGIEQVNAHLASFETIKKFRVLPVQFSIEGGELTPTMKLKRKVVSQKFAREIDELFR
jgi:long-chain acyl-CoA synthetase